MTSYTVAEKAQIFTFVPDRLLDLLAGHLPTSLTILRRLQFASYTNLSSHDSHIVFSSDIGTLDNKSTKTKHFAVTFVDLLGGPDTQMWFYSSMEAADYENLSQSELHIHETHIMKCVYALVQIRKRFACDLAYGNSVLLGSLHSEVCKILIKNKRILPLPSGKYDKWLFKVQDIPSWDMPLWEGMYWAEASLGDCQIAASRTDLPRPPEMLMKLPALMLKLQDGRPIAWAFIAFDGSIISLYCEGEYRRRGIAKMLVSKLLRENVTQLPGAEWSSADVAPDNAGSQSICKKLNGTPHWSVSWVTLDLSESV